MGDVIPLRIEMTEADFFTAWKKECAEWDAIVEEVGLYRSGKMRITAGEVTSLQHGRMYARNERPLDIPRIRIIGKGWLIPR
jgi:hypothetical protein